MAAAAPAATAAGCARWRIVASAAAGRGESGKFLRQFAGTAVRTFRAAPVGRADQDFAIAFALLAMKFVDGHGRKIIGAPQSSSAFHQQIPLPLPPRPSPKKLKVERRMFRPFNFCPISNFQIPTFCFCSFRPPSSGSAPRSAPPRLDRLGPLSDLRPPTSGVLSGLRSQVSFLALLATWWLKIFSFTFLLWSGPAYPFTVEPACFQPNSFLALMASKIGGGTNWLRLSSPA